MGAVTERKGIVFDIQRFTIHDGPGIRTEVFLKGCPLRCLWCSNPESISPELELGVFPDKCIGVNKAECMGANKIAKCIEACITMFKKRALGEAKCGIAPEAIVSSALIVKHGQVVGKDRNLCINCLECVKVCPSGTLVTFGKVMTVEQVMHELEKDTPFYNESGGGVTFSGGDPLVQHEFTLELLKGSKRRGLHTCLETEGQASWTIIEKMLPYVDMMLYDIKHMDSKKHKEYTGVGNELLLQNLKKLASCGVPLIIRTPVVPGFTDSVENIDATAEFVSQLGSAVKQFQLLPYFSLMHRKYKALGLEYKLPLHGPSKEELTDLLELTRSRRVPAVVGAYSEIEREKS